MNQTILDECWSKIGPQQNRTKCPYHRVRNLFTHCSNYIDNSIEGDFVEVGTWKGGCSALMGKMCDLEGKNRKVWALDSFEGMSPPDSSVDLLEGETPRDKVGNWALIAVLILLLLTRRAYRQRR